MTDDELLYDVENGIGTVTLNRPQGAQRHHLRDV